MRTAQDWMWGTEWNFGLSWGCGQNGETEPKWRTGLRKGTRAAGSTLEVGVVGDRRTSKDQGEEEPWGGQRVAEVGTG